MKNRISVFLLSVFIFTTLISSCNNKNNRVFFTINPENRIIVIPVNLNDSIIANMCFDTGCSVFTLDSLFYVENPNIGLKSSDTKVLVGSNWSYNQVFASVYDHFITVKIGNVNLTYQNCYVFNYKKYFSSNLDGIFGIPQKDTTHVWELNFEHNYLEIHKADDYMMPKNCFLLPLMNDFIVQLPIKIDYSDGDTLTIFGNYFIDLGMPQDIVLVRSTKEELDFFNKIDDAVWITKNSQDYQLRYTVNATLFDHFAVDSLRIYTLDNTRRLKSERMIGINFLKRFNVFFDQKNRQLGLQPIPNFQRIVSPYNGRFYFSSERLANGQTVVKEIADFKGNPYKEAGVKVGDEVYMINDILYKDVTYEDALKFKGETLRWVFLRDGEQIIVIKPFDENYDIIID